ncbi:MAG: TVP38/TMEM64 family protein [Phycisphaerae bacterium]|nr:TVP38/TMEM64 family protein [Phycisphaerae bacterium]
MSQEPTAPTSDAPRPHPSEGDGLGAVLRRLGPAGLLGLAWSILPAVAGTFLLAFMPTVAEWVLGHREVGYWLYIAVFVFSAGFGLLPTYSQSLLAGYAFGLVGGIPAALAGFVGASMVGYLVARTVGRDRVEREIARHPKAKIVTEALIGGSRAKTLGIVTLLRLPPNSPFALTNLVMSTCGVRKPEFLIGTAVGMAPRTIAAVWVGTQVQDWKEQDRPTWLLVAGIVLAVVALGVIGSIANRALAHLHQGPGRAPRAGGA